MKALTTLLGLLEDRKVLVLAIVLKWKIFFSLALIEVQKVFMPTCLKVSKEVSNIFSNRIINHVRVSNLSQMHEHSMWEGAGQHSSNLHKHRKASGLMKLMNILW